MQMIFPAQAALVLRFQRTKAPKACLHVERKKSFQQNTFKKFTFLYLQNLLLANGVGLLDPGPLTHREERIQDVASLADILEPVKRRFQSCRRFLK